MNRSIRIWTSAAHHSAFRCGGWAYVRVVGGEVSGVAGGERNTSEARMALAGLAAALRDLPPLSGPGGAATIAIRTSSPTLAAQAGWITGAGGAGQDPPQDDLDLWAQILVIAKSRALSVTRVPPAPATPAAFTFAWAELARDKAKMGGAFISAIPRPNLAKIGGLDEP